MQTGDQSSAQDTPYQMISCETPTNFEGCFSQPMTIMMDKLLATQLRLFDKLYILSQLKIKIAKMILRY